MTELEEDFIIFAFLLFLLAAAWIIGGKSSWTRRVKK